MDANMDFRHCTRVTRKNTCYEKNILFLYIVYDKRGDTQPQTETMMMLEAGNLRADPETS
jgi:hypothetical protein